jgi:hypothetical protein
MNKDQRKGRGPEELREPRGDRLGPAYARALLAELPDRPGVREMASALQLDVREVNAEGFEGALIRAENLPVGAIVVRESIRETGRKNFTIAHEIGHFVLPDLDQASLACTASDVANWSDSSKQLERQADEFAAELLMPASLVQGIIQDAPPSLQLIEEIARKSRSSLSAAAWRYCDLTTERCAVVWSTDGATHWSKRATAFGIPLPKGRRIEKGSFAAACFAKAKIPKRPRPVPARLWISSADLKRHATLWEQSKALPAYRSVITLLWIKQESPSSAH